MAIKPLPQPGDRLEPITLLEGAALLMLMAGKMSDQLKVQTGPYIRLRRIDVVGYATAMRSAAAIVDHLTSAVERGETFDESLKLPQ